jgi:hypothetical protein
MVFIVVILVRYKKERKIENRYHPLPKSDRKPVSSQYAVGCFMAIAANGRIGIGKRRSCAAARPLDFLLYGSTLLMLGDECDWETCGFPVTFMPIFNNAYCSTGQKLGVGAIDFWKMR